MLVPVWTMSDSHLQMQLVLDSLTDCMEAKVQLGFVQQIFSKRPYLSRQTMHSLMSLDNIAMQTVQSVFYMLRHPVHMRVNEIDTRGSLAGCTKSTVPRGGGSL